MSILMSSPQTRGLIFPMFFMFGAVIFAPLTAAAQSPGQPRVRLKNGVTIQGAILKETAENLFIDLGYDVLNIPQSTIEKLETSPQSDGVTSGAIEAQPLPSSTRQSFATHAEMIEYSKRGVVIVSNPIGLGAGFIIDSKGRVLTNHHVVKDAQYHAVTLIQKGEDGVLRQKKIENVELVAFSRLMDIALLQIPAKDLEGLEFVSLPIAAEPVISSGEPVYAIGNPGMGRQILDHSVSSGIVSSTNRNLGEIIYLQTTAAVNPGNSGGPLLNDQGEVIGFITLKASFQENIAFALPVNYIRLFLQNEKAFAFDKSNPNRAYRYLPPEKELER